MPESVNTNFPIGEPISLEKTKETLPAAEVDNRVLWVNPTFGALPFDLKEGQSTQLGMFLTPLHFTNDQYPKNVHRIEAENHHHRSGLLGKVIFNDKEGRKYRDIDIKGLGYITTAYARRGKHLDVAPSNHKHDRFGQPIGGVLDLRTASYDATRNEELLKLGVRVPRAVAIIELKELITSSGEKMSVKQAKRRGTIGWFAKPVLEIRAFSTHARICDASGEKGRLFLNDSLKLVASELGKDEKEFGLLEYAHWFSRAVGKNLGIMYQNNKRHGYLHDQNITLDARFVDFDSVRDVTKIFKGFSLKRDFDDAKDSLDSLFRTLKFNKQQRESLFEEMRESMELRKTK